MILHGVSVTDTCNLPTYTRNRWCNGGESVEARLNYTLHSAHRTALHHITQIPFARIPYHLLRYYDCTIQEVTANGYKIIFPAYGNVEEVPLEYLQKKVTLSLAKV